MKQIATILSAGAAITMSFSAAFTAHAQNFPERPVRFVVNFPPGGSTDFSARILAQHLTAVFGQTIVVDNRGGGGGNIGIDIVAKAAPDGYTLVVSGVASHAVAPALAAKPPFDPVKDFTHIALFGGPPTVLAVHPSLPARDLKSFVALAKARPNDLNFGSPGNGTQGHLIGELFKRSAGFNMAHVPYRGASVAVVDLIAGHLQVISTTLTTASAQIKAGRMRALAISSAARLPDYATVPTYNESGYPDLVAAVWFSLSGPPNLPADITTKLNTEVRRILQLPDVRERLRADGVEANQLDAKGFNDFVAAEVKRWTPVVKASGAKLD